MPGTFSPPPQVSDPDMHQDTCVTHVPLCMPGSLISGFLWSPWRRKRSRHSRRMRNHQFYVSSKRPIYQTSFAIHHSVESPGMVDPSRIYGIEGPSEICTQSAEVRLAVSGAQPLFTLGLPMFALSPVDFLSLLLSPNTYFNIFYFCQKYHLNYTYKICKKIPVGLKLEWGL